jgi:hypothetical protein
MHQDFCEARDQYFKLGITLFRRIRAGMLAKEQIKEQEAIKKRARTLDSDGVCIPWPHQPSHPFLLLALTSKRTAVGRRLLYCPKQKAQRSHSFVIPLDLRFCPKSASKLRCQKASRLLV